MQLLLVYDVGIPCICVYLCYISYNVQDFNLVFYCGRLGTKVRDNTLAGFWAASRNGVAHKGQPDLGN